VRKFSLHDWMLDSMSGMGPSGNPRGGKGRGPCGPTHNAQSRSWEK